MKKAILATICVLALSACSDEGGARKALSAQGYTDISITGWKMFGCGRDDTFTTGFSAKSMNGTPVTGVVCSDFFKGATIRVF